MHTYFLLYRLGSRLDEKDCRNLSRKDCLTAFKLQTIIFKSSNVGEKAVRCHKSEVWAVFKVGFFVMATSNITNLQSRQLSQSTFLLFLNFKELLLAVIW